MRVCARVCVRALCVRACVFARAHARTSTRAREHERARVCLRSCVRARERDLWCRVRVCRWADESARAWADARECVSVRARLRTTASPTAMAGFGGSHLCVPAVRARARTCVRVRAFGRERDPRAQKPGKDRLEFGLACMVIIVRSSSSVSEQSIRPFFSGPAKPQT
jgi:hypothetical protein